MANENVTLEEQIVVEANKAIKALNDIKKSVKGVKNETSGAGKAIKAGLTFGGIIAGGKKLLNFFKSANSEAMNLIETVNLFEVSMGKGVEGLNQYYDKAIKFQNQLSEALGTNINESMNFQALFNSMGTSMGLDRAVAYRISENFTKLGYDLASLYNTETDKAMQKLQSGLSGSSTRPLRSFGIDITQNTLANTLSNLGIDRTISQLSQAEKMVLRYIAVLEQSTVAHGDFARTLESPANQLRIFQAQCLAFKQNIGSLWQGIYARWMPYINGIMMAINALIKVIGGLFGVKFNSSISTASKSLQTGAGGAGGIASGLKDATGSAKDLKEQLDLMPWDEIHNIELPKDSSSGGSGGSGGGGGGAGGGSIDPALLNAMKDYDNMMDKVKNKATDIRDKIMEWLGFTKRINPFTNEISWDYTGMSKSAKLVLTALKGIVAVGLAVKLVKFLGHLKTLMGVIKGTVTPTTAFQVGLASIGKTFGNIVAGGKATVETFTGIYKATDGSRLTKFSTALSTSVKEMWSLIPVAVKATAGIAGLGVSVFTTFKAMRDLSDGNEKASTSFIKLGAGMAGAVASGALLGSIIPGIGTAVGALIGGVIGLTGALIGWRSESEKLHAKVKEDTKATKEYVQSVNEQKQAINDSVNGQMAYIGYVEKLTGELDGLVDAEGNVKKGMEERVKFILGQLNEAMGTEYKLIDNHVEGYKDLAKSIKDVIAQKKLEILLNANEEAYTDAIKRKAEIQGQIYDYQKQINQARKEQYDIEEQISQLNPDNFFDALKIHSLSAEYDNLTNGIKGVQENIDELSNVYRDDSELIIAYETSMADAISEDTDRVNEATERMAQMNTTKTSEMGRNVAEMVRQELDDYRTLVDKRGELTEEEYNIQEAGHKKQLQELSQTLVDITDTTNASEPGIVEAWRLIADNSETEYDKYISLLDPTTRKAVEDALKTLDGKREDARKSGEGVSGATLDGAKSEIDNPTNGIVAIGNFLIQGLLNSLTGGPVLGMLWQAGQTVIGKVLEGAQQKADEHSPSKATYRIGDYLVQGLALGIKENTSDAVNAVKETMGRTLNEANKFANGINVNPSEYSVNANKFIDYGQINGSILNQIDLSGNISDKVYTAVMNGLRNSTIEVAIEAKTEEGILLKKVQNQAKQYRTQTGKVPFPTM